MISHLAESVHSIFRDPDVTDIIYYDKLYMEKLGFLKEKRSLMICGRR